MTGIMQAPWPRALLDRAAVRARSPEDMMKVLVYGDFNCPYSSLASQRAGRLIREGIAQVDWRALEHDWRLALTGTPSQASQSAWGKELAEVAALALPGEHAPAAPPPVVSNIRSFPRSSAPIGPCGLASLDSATWRGAAVPPGPPGPPAGVKLAPDAGRQPLTAARVA